MVDCRVAQLNWHGSLCRPVTIGGEGIKLALVTSVVTESSSDDDVLGVAASSSSW